MTPEQLAAVCRCGHARRFHQQGTIWQGYDTRCLKADHVGDYTETGCRFFRGVVPVGVNSATNREPQWTVLHDMDHGIDSECPYCQKERAASIAAALADLGAGRGGITWWPMPVVPVDHPDWLWRAHYSDEARESWGWGATAEEAIGAALRGDEL